MEKIYDISFIENFTVMGLLFNHDQIEELLLKYPPLIALPKTTLIVEGQASRHLIFSINEAFYVNSSMTVSSDVPLAPGRSFNLYSLLRGFPFQYNLCTKNETLYFQLPWHEIQNRIDSLPSLKKYLLMMTEREDFKILAKDCDHAGCSKEFRLAFLGSLEEVKMAPHTWLAKQDETVIEPFILLEGIVQASKTIGGKRVQSHWKLPLRSWTNWTEASANLAGRFSLRSQSNISLFKLPAKIQRQLKDEFPDDFQKYTNWITNSGLVDNETLENETDVDVDLNEILENSPTTKFQWWKKFPFVMQNDQMDCGPACLAMISCFYGKELPLQFWRSQLSTNREGTSLFDIAVVAEKNGLISHAFEAENLSAIDSATLPVIVLRKYHYMVLYKIAKDYVVVGDSGYGIKKMTHHEFHQGFEQVYLFMRPTAEFSEHTVESEPNSHFFKLGMVFKNEILLALACSIFLVCISLAPPILTQTLLDDVIGTKDTDLLKIILGGFFGFIIFNQMMTWARAYYVNYISSKFDFLAKSSFVQKMLSLPYQYFATRHVGDFTRRLQEFEKVRSFITNTGITLLLNFFSLIIYFCALFLYNYKIGLLALVLAPPFLFISMAFSRKLTTLYSETFTSMSDQDSYITDVIKGIQSIKSMGAELSARRRFEERLAKTLKSRYRFQLTGVMLVGFVDMYFYLVKYGMMGFTVYLAMHRELTPGQVVALSMIISQVLEPFEKMAYQWSDFQEVKAVLSRLNDVFLATSENASSLKLGQKHDHFHGEIEFKDVWFKYGGEGSDWILKGVSFRIEAGENLAIVGPSGSGKSTIVQLLVRMYTPNKGQIFIDGKDYREYDLNWLREKIGLITQESHLFACSIEENLTFPFGEIEAEKMQKAAEIADASNFIEKKSGHYKHLVPSGGYGFSGGEKQRLTLARTLYKNPSLLILDEATSALDGISEKTFLKNIHMWSKDKTIISIAHRFSTVKYSNLVLVLNEGRLVALGTHDELAQTCALYQELFAETLQQSRDAA